MLPCSVSTKTQSKPHRAIVLEWLLPGSICHAPNVRPEPVRSAFWSRLAACMVGDGSSTMGSVMEILMSISKNSWLCYGCFLVVCTWWYGCRVGRCCVVHSMNGLNSINGMTHI